MKSSECDSEVTIIGIVSGILLIIGTIVSCLPQVVQIVLFTDIVVDQSYSRENERGCKHGFGDFE